jgi:dolichol-phosphate mannosyltransferase
VRTVKRTLIVTPTYNELANLESFVASVRANAPEADILIVDDASPDGTGELADRLAANDPHVRVMHRPGKLGLGSAYVQAFRHGLEQGYDRFVQMDADQSHNPEHLDALFQALDDGADVAVGSRNISGGDIVGWSLGRHVLSKGGSLYSRLILSVPVRDMTTGYNAFTRRAVEAIDLSTIHSNGYSFQIEMKYRALRQHLRLVEVPIVFVDRGAGKSKMDRKIFLEAIGVVWRLRWEALRGVL